MSSIGHYIQHGKEGFLLEPVSASSLVEQIGHLSSIDPLHHQSMLTLQHEVCKRFTFGQYHQKIGNQLLNP
jgi:acetate kinase